MTQTTTMVPAGGAGPRGLEFWGGGAVRSRNIGPATGEHLLGRVEGPGLYMFIAANSEGKSHHLRLLTKLQDARLLRSDSDIADGADTATLEFALCRVVFRRGPSGEFLEPTRDGADTLPRIEELPAPIDIVLNGANRKGVDERLRARLEALLKYIPVPCDEVMLRRLAAAMADRLFSDDPGDDRRREWKALGDVAKERHKRLAVHPFRTSEEIITAVLAEPRETILEDFERMVDLLNGGGNVAEKIAAIQGERVERERGKFDGAVEAAARRTGWDGEDISSLVIDLRERATAAPFDAAILGPLRVKAATLRAQLDSRVAETNRRQQLRSTRGERPDTDAVEAEHQEARDALASAKVRLDAATASRDKVRLDIDKMQPGRIAKVAEIKQLLELADISYRELAGFFRSEGEVRIPSFEISGEVSATTRTLLSHIAALSDVPAAARLLDDASLKADLVNAEVDLLAASQAHAVAATVEKARAASVTTAQEQVSAWDATEALLNDPIEGPNEDEVLAAEQEVLAAERDQLLAAAADDLKVASLALDREVETLDWFTGIAEEYRAAAQDAWKYLGTVLTEALGLPWLEVENSKILLRYESAGAGSRLVSVRGEHDDVRNLDDQGRVSRAELHEAVLKLMLSRREQLGGILIIPDATLYPLDEAHLHTFSGWCRDAGLWVFSERPRRRGDAETLTLEYVTPPPAGEEGGAS